MIITDDAFHFLGEDLPVSFNVMVNDQVVKPYSISVEVYYTSKGNRKIFSDLFRPKDEEIIYVLKKNIIKKPGDYALVFFCRLREYGSHILIYKTKVRKNQVEGVTG